MRLEFAIGAVSAYLVGCGYGCWLFDKLLRMHYEQHRLQWEREGSTRGYWWKPPGPKITIWSRQRTTILFLKWLLRTPPWVTQSPKARSLLIRVRLIFVPSIVVYLVLMGAFFRS